jgi:uncharacterized protein YebE (UPF0316 family)
LEYFVLLPVWAVAILIFLLRVVDVSLGTMRTIAVIQGRIQISVLLGFFEILIWITAISHVMANLSATPLLLLAYAGGFATGNATGIILERKFALGRVMIRLVSAGAGEEIKHGWQKRGARVVIVIGQGHSGAESVLYCACSRRQARDYVALARAIDSQALATIEPVLEHEPPLCQPLPHATGWRATFLRK